MRTIITLIAILLLPIGQMNSQDDLSPEMEVNTQVWQAFKTAYEARDSNAFKAIHTQDVLRVNDGGIKTAEMYFESIDAWNALGEGRSIVIDFAFENRQYYQDIGYETGYYRVVMSREGGPSNTFYGQFHVVLRKENGRWKIAQDFDTSTVGGRAIDRSFFDEAVFLTLD